MKRTALKKVGRIGEANKIARQEIARIAEERNLNYCELAFEGCQNWPLAPAHRHKRSWYKGDAKLLSDFSQWVCACQRCHGIIENDPQLTEEMFIKLRPPLLTTLN